MREKRSEEGLRSNLNLLLLLPTAKKDNNMMIIPKDKRLQALGEVFSTIEKAKAYGMKDEMIAKALKTDINHLVQIEIALMVQKPLPLTQRMLNLASDLDFKLNIQEVLYASH